MVAGKCPRWLAVLSNRVLPPLFFFSLALLLFHTSNSFEGIINFELSLAGVFAGIMTFATTLS